MLHTAGVGYDSAVDSWSVGIIVYAMLTKVRLLSFSLAFVVADRTSPAFLSEQLLPFTEESGDPIETRLRKRQMESVDYSPFVQLGISVMGQSASLKRTLLGSIVCLTKPPPPLRSTSSRLCGPTAEQRPENATVARGGADPPLDQTADADRHARTRRRLVHVPGIT